MVTRSCGYFNNFTMDCMVCFYMVHHKKKGLTGRVLFGEIFGIINL